MAPQFYVVGTEPTDAMAEAAQSPLAVSGLTVTYARKPVLWNVDYVAPPNARIAIIGPNGAGKSTFVKAVLGLVPTLAGEVRVFGQPVNRQRRQIAYVPQRESVDWDFPASALDVVTMGLYGRIGWCRPVRKHHKDEALGYLDKVGMADFAQQQIGQLSGGQQQRVFLARALAQDARVYIMDEPFAGVDAATERAIVTLLKTLEAEGKTVICVHHDLQSAGDYFTHGLVLNMRRIAAGTIEQVLDESVLQAAYGGRLAPTELAALRRSA